MRAALTVAGLALAFGGLTGCGGGDDGPPADASKDDFCANFQALDDDLADVEDADVPGAIKIIKDAISKIEETGTPEGIPDGARDGLQTTIDHINDLDDDASQADLDEVGESLSDTEQKNSDAFDDYLEKTCDL